MIIGLVEIFCCVWNRYVQKQLRKLRIAKFESRKSFIVRGQYCTRNKKNPASRNGIPSVQIINQMTSMCKVENLKLLNQNNSRSTDKMNKQSSRERLNIMSHSLITSKAYQVLNHLGIKICFWFYTRIWVFRFKQSIEIRFSSRPLLIILFKFFEMILFLFLLFK